MPTQTSLLAHVETQVVKVPVNVRCVSLSELPPVPRTRMDPEKQTVEQLVTAIRIDINNLEDYAIRADALLRACAIEPQPVKP